MAKATKKASSRKTGTKRTSSGRGRKTGQSWIQKNKMPLFVICFALVATILISSSFALSPAVKNLKSTQKAELRALKDRHEIAEDIKDDQCDAMSGSQEDICEDELKLLKDNNEAEEDVMKARHKAAVKALKASESSTGNNTGSNSNNNSGTGTGNSGGTNGQTGSQGTNGGAGGAGGSGSCTGNCSGNAGSNGTGTNGTGTNGNTGTSNPGTSNPGSAGSSGSSSAPGASGGGSASQAASFEIVMQVRTEQPGGRCMDVTGWGTANGTPVQLWDCHDGTVQRWGISPGPNRTFTSILSGKCLDVDAAFGGRNGSPVEIFDCHGGINQQWIINGSEMRSAWTGRCLDVTNWGSANGARLQIWDCGGGANQQWFGGRVY